MAKDDNQDKVNRQYEKFADILDDISSNYTKPLSILTKQFDAMGGKGKLLGAVFTVVSTAIDHATRSAKQFYTALNSISGIQGHVGELAEAITRAASGSVSRQEIADFLAATDNLFQNAAVTKSQIPIVKNLLSVYGDLGVAQEVYQSALMLSTEGQADFAKYLEEASKIIEQTPTAKLEAMNNAIQDTITTIGNDLLYLLQPVLTFIAGITEALRQLNSDSGSLGLSEEQAYEKLQALAEKYGLTLEELNQIQKGVFTSSLDEVTSLDMGMVGEGDSIFGISSEGLDNIADSAEGVSGKFDNWVSIITSLKDIFGELFEAIDGPLGDVIAHALDAGASFLKWANDSDMLLPSLIAIVGAVGLLKMGMGDYVGGALIVAGAVALGLTSLSALSSSAGADSLGTSGFVGASREPTVGPTISLIVDGDRMNSSLGFTNRGSGGLTIK